MWLSSETEASLRLRFDYLFPLHSPAEGDVKRRVAALDWRPLRTHDDEFDAAPGLRIRAFPVLHGGEYVSLAFLFGEPDRVAYISDVSTIPEAAFQLLEAAGPLALLVVDCLFRAKQHNTHFNLPSALAAARRLRPRRTLLTGLSHEFDHTADNEALARLREEEGLDVQLAHDGLLVPLAL